MATGAAKCHCSSVSNIPSVPNASRGLSKWRLDIGFKGFRGFLRGYVQSFRGFLVVFWWFFGGFLVVFLSFGKV